MILTTNQIIKKYKVSKATLDLWRRGVLFRSRGKSHKSATKLPYRKQRGVGCPIQCIYDEDKFLKWCLENKRNILTY